MGLLRSALRAFWASAVVLGLAECGLLQQPPEIDAAGCTRLCLALEDCQLLPSALGTDKANCEARCNATQRAEGSRPSDASDASGGMGQAGSMSDDESARVLACVRDEERDQGGYWCSESSSGEELSCRLLSECLDNGLANEAALGTAMVSVSLVGNASDTPREGESCLHEWTPLSTNCDVAIACQGISSVTLLGDLGAITDERDGDCAARLDKTLRVGSIWAGVHEPRFKIMRGPACDIVTGQEQLAPAGKTVTLYVPLNVESLGGAGGGSGGLAGSCGGSGGTGGESAGPVWECESGSAQCSDRVDNDLDDRIDCEDPACVDACVNPTSNTGGAGGGVSDATGGFAGFGGDELSGDGN